VQKKVKELKAIMADLPIIFHPFFITRFQILGGIYAITI
jgi:hypothetical protein